MARNKLDFNSRNVVNPYSDLAKSFGLAGDTLSSFMAADTAERNNKAILAKQAAQDAENKRRYEEGLLRQAAQDAENKRRWDSEQTIRLEDSKRKQDEYNRRLEAEQASIAANKNLSQLFIDVQKDPNKLSQYVDPKIAEAVSNKKTFINNQAKLQKDFLTGAASLNPSDPNRDEKNTETGKIFKSYYDNLVSNLKSSGLTGESFNEKVRENVSALGSLLYGVQKGNDDNELASAISQIDENARNMVSAWDQGASRAVTADDLAKHAAINAIESDPRLNYGDVYTKMLSNFSNIAPTREALKSAEDASVKEANETYKYNLELMDKYYDQANRKVGTYKTSDDSLKYLKEVGGGSIGGDIGFIDNQDAVEVFNYLVDNGIRPQSAATLVLGTTESNLIGDRTTVELGDTERVAALLKKGLAMDSNVKKGKGVFVDKNDYTYTPNTARSIDQILLDRVKVKDKDYSLKGNDKALKELIALTDVRNKENETFAAEENIKQKELTQSNTLPDTTVVSNFNPNTRYNEIIALGIIPDSKFNPETAKSNYLASIKDLDVNNKNAVNKVAQEFGVSVEDVVREAAAFKSGRLGFQPDYVYSGGKDLPLENVSITTALGAAGLGAAALKQLLKKPLRVFKSNISTVDSKKAEEALKRRLAFESRLDRETVEGQLKRQYVNPQAPYSIPSSRVAINPKALSSNSPKPSNSGTPTRNREEAIIKGLSSAQKEADDVATVANIFRNGGDVREVITALMKGGRDNIDARRIVQKAIEQSYK